MQNNQPQNREELLERVEDIFVIDVYEDGSEEFDVYEDDGMIHINHYGIRVVPELNHGQGSSRRDFDREVNEVLRGLGYSFVYRGSGIV